MLDVLGEYNAQATFFCIGNNVKNNPLIYERILREGHAVGNHTHNHVNGWKTADAAYIENVMLARKYIHSNLFRPPYGRISRSQIKQLAPDFKIIMWDVLSADFDIKLSPEKSYQYVVDHASSGSIIVFHDSDKAWPRLKYALPKALQVLSQQGYCFKSLQATGHTPA